MIGQQLQHYKIVEKIGEGGMGEVYLAHDEKLDRKVALKILPERLADEDDRLRRFQREARTIASLNHPSIVTIYAVEEVDGVHFLAMELIEGRALEDLIPSNGMVLEDFFSYAIPVVDALSAAHEQGITHRDIKPSNVMVNDGGHVKVLDFGLAKLEAGFGGNIEASTQTLTEEGSIIGTVPYMAPEQFTGRDLDARTDLFSLGILFHQMLTGARPFKGDSSAELISSILRDKPEPVSEIKSNLPNHLGRIVRRCLEKDPERRYQTAIDLRNELEDLKREVDSGVLRLPASALPPELGTASPAGSARPRWLAPAAAVAVVALLLLAALGLRGGGEPPVETPTPDEELSTTVAVLPLSELGEASDPTFAGRLTDEVANRLTRLPGLQIVSQSTVARSATGGATAKQIGEQVGADLVLEGSLYWSQVEDDVSVVRFTERLIRVEDDIQVLFHDQLAEYEKPLELQSRLAVEVAELLGGEVLELSALELEALFPPPLPDITPDDIEETEPTRVARAQRPARRRPEPEPAPRTEDPPAPAEEASQEEPSTPEPEPVAEPAGPLLVPVQVTLETPLDDGILTIYAGDQTVFRRPFKPRRRSEAESLPTSFDLPVGASALRIYAAPAGKPARLERLELDVTEGATGQLEIRVTRRGEVRAKFQS